MNELKSVGIDISDNQLLIAEVLHDSVRPQVVKLEATEIPEKESIAFAPDLNVTLSIPDKQVTVRHMRLKPDDSFDLGSRCQFEMSSSLLEDINNFQFDCLISKSRERQLGLIYRRTLIYELKAQTGFDSEQDVTCISRAVALGRGLIAFGEHVPDEFFALADFSDRTVTICLIYKREIVDIARLSADKTSLTNSADLEHLIIELKTLINFRIAALAEQGITLPLSSLIINSELIDTGGIDLIKRYFPVGVSRASINTGFLGEKIDSQLAPEKFLISLGLTVK